MNQQEQLYEQHMPYIEANARFRHLRHQYEQQQMWGEQIIEARNEELTNEHGFPVPHLQVPFNYLLPNGSTLHTANYNAYDNDIEQGIHARHRNMNTQLEAVLAEGEQLYDAHNQITLTNSQATADIIEEHIDEAFSNSDRFDGGWAYWREHGFIDPMENGMGDDGDIEQYEEMEMIERDDDGEITDNTALGEALVGVDRDYIMGYRTSQDLISDFISQVQDEVDTMRNHIGQNGLIAQPLAPIPQQGGVFGTHLLAFTDDMTLPEINPDQAEQTGDFEIGGMNILDYTLPELE